MKIDVVRTCPRMRRAEIFLHTARSLDIAARVRDRRGDYGIWLTLVAMSVWSLLAECADQLDEPFQRSQIVGWFRRHHPEVLESTLAAHIQAATGNATNRAQNHPNLASRQPLLQRIDHGLYVRADRSQPMSAAKSQQPRMRDDELRQLRSREYVDTQVVASISARANSGMPQDYSKLLRLINELNENYRHGHAYAAHVLLRAILDHIPPIFGFKDFAAVANNYGWSRTDKAYMRKLLDFKLQADDVLHRQISHTPDRLSLDDMPARAWVNRLLQESADRPLESMNDQASNNPAHKSRDDSTFPSPQARRAGPGLGRTSRPEHVDGDPATAMLQTLQSRGHASSLQAIYDGLSELGYIPHIPAVRQAGGAPTQYLRWTDPSRGGPAVIYFQAGSLWFVRTEDLTALADLPAGTTTLGGRQHNVHFPISPHTTDQILLAARRVKH